MRRGKRTVALCVCAVWMLLAACAGAQEAARDPAGITPAVTRETASPEPEGTPSPVSAGDAHARGYGEEEKLVADGNGFSCTLRYPRGDVLPVNEAIADWASEALFELETRAVAEAARADGLRAEADIQYDAYLYQARFIGVKETGTYRAAVSGEVTPVLFAYNYDLAASRELTLPDVIEPAHTDAVRALVAERLLWLGATALSGADALTDTAMRDFVIRDDGVEWLFRGAEGVVGVLLDYAALAPYLCMEAPVSAAPARGEAADDAVAEQQAVCLYDGVQARTLPSLTEGAAIATMRAGETLDVLDANVTKGWHEIRYHGHVAFVPASLVQLSGEDAAYVDGYVTCAYLHVRSFAGASGELLDTMVYQERVRVIDPTPIEGWYKIWYEGNIAYVRAQYVALGFYPPESQAATEMAETGEIMEQPRILRQTLAPIIGVGVCETDGVIVRSAPNTKASGYGVLFAGDQVFIMEEACAPGWDRIFVYTEAGTGYIGYVSASYVRSFVPDAPDTLASALE